MKKFLTILTLILTFQTPSQADDIRDFQIEGMSVGDSLLDYMTEDEINNPKRNYAKNKKYYVVGKINSLKIYEIVDIYLKSGDKSYEIKTLGGMILANKSECLPKKKKIEKELDAMFSNIKKISYNDTSHSFDKTGKSKQSQAGYLFENDIEKDHIRVECTFWSKKIKKKHKFNDTLNVVVMTTEIQNWILDGYN